ncbi:MAG TPA: nuclear transport factor 2 family protein [Blastocatellia bacterium]|jgi:ketosteroid isomerase-like protein
MKKKYIAMAMVVGMMFAAYLVRGITSTSSNSDPLASAALTDEQKINGLVDYMQVANLSGPGIKASKQTSAEAGKQKIKGESRAVAQVVEAVLQAISNKDKDGILRHYAKDPENQFFNAALPELKENGAERYITKLVGLMKNMRSIKAIPNDDMQVKVSGNLAIVSLTGRNEIVTDQGVEVSGPWRWTVQLEKQANNWLITHDHLSFFAERRASIDGPAAGPFAGYLADALESV